VEEEEEEASGNGEEAAGQKERWGMVEPYRRTPTLLPLDYAV